MEVSGEYCSSTSTTRSTEEQNQREKHYRGVRMKKWGKWGAEILERTKRERIWLGSYSSPVAAARAYDTAAFYLQGPSRKLNFPEYIVEEDGNNLDMSVASIQKKAKEVGARVDALESALENGRSRIETEAVGTEGDGIREDQIEAVGIGGEGTREDEIEGEGIGEDEMAEAGLNTACLGKGKRKENTAGGEERETKKIGVRIAIPLEDILQSKEDAAINLRNGGMKYAFDTCAGTDSNTVSRPTEHGIPKWSPSKNNELISNSLPTETPVDVAQEQIPQSSSDILPPNQVLPIVDSNSMTVKARHVNGITMKFRLSSPWRKVELEQQVQKRLQLEAGTYYIKYKDMENELILIGCDEDLEDCISDSRSIGSSLPSSKSIGTSSIEVFLEPK